MADPGENWSTEEDNILIRIYSVTPMNWKLVKERLKGRSVFSCDKRIRELTLMGRISPPTGIAAGQVPVDAAEGRGEGFMKELAATLLAGGEVVEDDLLLLDNQAAAAMGESSLLYVGNASMEKVPVEKENIPVGKKVAERLAAELLVGGGEVEEEFLLIDNEAAAMMGDSRLLSVGNAVVEGVPTEKEVVPATEEEEEVPRE